MTTLELQKLFASSNYLANHASAFARLELEPLSDTGNAIPIGITLQAPSGLAFSGFDIYAPDNPVPQVFQIKLGEAAPNYRFDVRIRLGASQDVWLVAKLSNGLVMGMLAPTVLTSSACFDAS